MSNIMDDIEFELSRNNDLTLDLEDIPTGTHEVLLVCKEEIERLEAALRRIRDHDYPNNSTTAYWPWKIAKDALQE